MNQDAATIDRLIGVVADVNGENDPLVTEARKVARRVAKNDPVTVEQGAIFPKAVTIPDGWSFDDINSSGRFVGNWWGLRLRRGEPMIFQRGHVLFIRQWEFFSDRDIGYYERISRVPGQSILVVIGYMGKREGYVAFENGKMGPITQGDAYDIADAIVAWLESVVKNPLPDWDRDREGL